jgi:hypothetical protein
MESELVQWIIAPFAWILRAGQWVLGILWLILSSLLHLLAPLANGPFVACVGLLVALGVVWKVSKSVGADIPKQTPEQDEPRPSGNPGLDEVYETGDVARILECLRKEVRRRLGTSYDDWTDRAIVRHLTATGSSDQQVVAAVLEQFERAAYRVEPVLPEVVETLYRRVKLEGA